MINCIAVVVALAVVSVSGSKAPTCDMTPDQHSAVTETVLDDLRKKGYSVTEGTFEEVDCNLFGSNLLAPYVVYSFKGLSSFLPSFLSSFLQSFLSPCFFDSPIFIPKLGSAILNIGCTPFGVDYFSYRSYLLLNNDYSFVFASLGDSLNNQVIKTTGDDGIVQGRTAAVITTGAESTLSDITAALTIAGLGNAINVDAYSPSMIKSPYSQPLVMLHRAHIWENPDEKAAYFAQKRKIYMIKRSIFAPAAKLFASIPERRKGSGVNERSLVPDYKNMRAILKSGIKKQFSTSRSSSTELYSFPLNRTDCIINGSNCYGDNSDATYFLGLPREYKLGPDNIYVIFGTNCVKTGRCTYSSIGFHKLSDSIGYVDTLPIVVDYRKFDGSAQWFAPSLPLDVADSFFAYAVARSCFGIPFCVEIPSADLSDDDFWHPIFRTVLDPKTGTGLKVSETVPPTIMRFSSIQKDLWF